MLGKYIFKSKKYKIHLEQLKYLVASAYDLGMIFIKSE